MSESIYNLVPSEYSLPQKQPMHKSSHNPKLNVTGSTFGCQGTTRLPGAGTVVKKDGALFGPPDPAIMKIHKRANEMKNEIDSYKTSYLNRTKEALPPKEDQPILGIRTSKNFVVANAVEAILQAPKKPDNKELNYTKKEDFGKVPAYLAKVKEEIRRENDMIERYVKEKTGEVERLPEELEEMYEDEKQELLWALKAKWEAVNVKYQKITHLVDLDTTGQVRRKEQLEKELQTLENHIERLDRPGTVLIRK